MRTCLGVVLDDLGKRSEAEAAYRAALGIQERLAADFPAVPEYRQDLANSHNNLGIVLDQPGKRAEAEAAYRAGLQIRERLAADFPALPEYRQELAASQQYLGRLLAGLGKWAEAEAAYRAVLEVNERLTTDFPAVPEYRYEPARSLYNLACLYGLATAATKDDSIRADQYATRAVDFLTRARAAGYFKERAKVEHFKKDENLRALRDRADFQRFLGDLEDTLPSPAK
jgi:tetratricopeptide (TPR) repeat protein